MSLAARRTALVHDWLTGMRGGEYVLEGLASLFPGCPIYTLLHLPGTVSPAIEEHPIRTSFLQRWPGVARHYRSFLPLFPAAIEELDLAGFDLVISSSHCVAKGIIPPPGALHVCYCHTPMRYAWDQQHAYFPRRKGPIARVRGFLLSQLRTWDVAASRRVDHFIANSRFVAERIRRYYGREAEVIHPPVDTDFFTPGSGDRDGFCLMVAALSPYKRVDQAAAACERLGIELRVVGDGPEQARLARRVGASTRLLGRVGAEELRALYRSALCLVQPGVEDFGISSAEALACGCPVVAVGRGGVLDVVRDGEDGVLYPEESGVDGLAQAIDKVRGLRFNELNLRERAGRYSGPRFKERVRELLERLTAVPQESAL